MKKRMKKKQKGNVLLTALMLIIVLSLLGWAFICTTINLSAQSQKAGLVKQAYYAADAGIQLAMEQMWSRFEDLGIYPTKTKQFYDEMDPNNAGNKISIILPSYQTEVNFGGGIYKITSVKPYIYSATDSSTNPRISNRFQVVVTVTVDGTIPLDTNGHYVKRTITADLKYYVAGSQLTDFSYFTNNFGFVSGATIGGSVATNGDFRYQQDPVTSAPPKIAGGDRYKSCKGWLPKYKIDDGGIFAANIINENAPSDYLQSFGDTMPAIDPNKGTMHVLNFNGISMPSLASTAFYESTAMTSETDARTAGKKYGIFSWAPQSVDRVLDAAGNPVVSAMTDPNGYVTDPNYYIKISDAVYGDGSTTYTGSPSYYISGKDPVTGGNVWKQGEKSNLIAYTADANHPIAIFGTVVVKGNVVIEGQIRGAGAIFAGKSLYIPDGLKYDRPPLVGGSPDVRGFVNSNDGDNTTQTFSQLETVRSNQAAWLTANQPGPADGSGTDILGLYANDNFIVGDVGQANTVPNQRIEDALSNTTGTIDIHGNPADPNQVTGTENVNRNEMDETKVGMDSVPNSRKIPGSAEYVAETNNQWDVKFYTASNPPPPNAKNPYYSNDPNCADPNCQTLSGAEPTGDYSTWTANQKMAVIPGSGEDLDGDGHYTTNLDMYDAIAYNQSKADYLRANNTDPNAWTSAFTFDPNDWGGNLNITGASPTATNYHALYEYLYTAPNTVFHDLGTHDYQAAYQIDALTYTNHVWGGICWTDINGGFLARVEAIAIGGMTKHDDRVVGGGESVFDAGVQVPQNDHLAVVNWKE